MSNKDFFSDGVVPDRKYFNLTADENLLPNGNMTNIIISEGITKIGASAFCGQKTTSLTMPKTLTEIGNGAFYKLPELTSVTFNSKLLTIGNNGFTYCGKLSTLIFQNDSVLSSIGEDCFYQCPIRDLSLPDSVLTIGDECFRDCGITSLKLSANLTTIGFRAFLGNSFQFLEIPTTVTTLGDRSFDNNTALEEVQFLGSKPPTMGDSSTVFDFSDNLKKVYIPKGSLSDYKSAFSNASAILNILTEK